MNRPTVIFIACVCVAVVLAAWLFRHTTPSRTARDGKQTSGETRDAKPHPPTRISTAREPAVKRTVRPTPGAVARQTTPPLVQDTHGGMLITGYVVDSFRGLTALPGGYSAQGMALTGQGLTLATSSGAGRIGTLESPPLPLRQPSTELTPRQRKELPDGATLQVEISASADGKKWSGWYLIERAQTSQAEQAVQAMDAAVQEALAARADSSRDVQGPCVKYRLTMTAFQTTCPVLHDLRIWRRPVSADADDLARELDRLGKETSATAAR